MTISEQITSLQTIVNLALDLQKDFPDDTALGHTISMCLYQIKQLKKELKDIHDKKLLNQF